MTERLAPGAPAPAGFVPLHVPELKGNESKYVQECLETNWVSSVGPFVDRFERELADYVGARHAIAIVNGTSALHLSLMLMGVERDDEVLMPALTFIAPANAIRYLGAWPTFIDIERNYWQIDPQKVADFLDRECERRDGVLRNKHTGRRVAALLPVGVLGHPCDMDALGSIARRHELPIVGDTTECLGAHYKNACMSTFCDIACFSFNGNKIITTGGGGMIVTGDDRLAERARYLSTQAKDDPVEYVHGAVGFNYRLTNVLAAIGVAQLEQLPSYVDYKRGLAARYTEGFRDVAGITPMRESPDVRSTFWLYTVLVDEERFGIGSRELLKHFAARKIQTRPLWQPLHQSRPHAESFAYAVEVADQITAQALSLPSSVSLDLQQQGRVIEALHDARRMHVTS
jgi:perosamine synthetase